MMGIRSLHFAQSRRQRLKPSTFQIILPIVINLTNPEEQFLQIFLLLGAIVISFSDLEAASSDFQRNQLDTTIQETDALNDGFNYRVNLTFTEPLGKKAMGTFGYQVSNNKTPC